MIFIANSLALNGGSTFLIRVCKELNERNEKVSVLILFNETDKGMYLELSQWAEIIFLQDYAYVGMPLLYKNQIGSFLPVSTVKLENLFIEHNREIHILGVFGLLFIRRLNIKLLNISVGIYHQNEFMFSDIDFYFANKAKKMFKELDSERVIFFNESSLVAYSNFFKKKYLPSNILPIGIDINKNIKLNSGCFNSARIVSIGNLYNFKTYNKHVISILPEILRVIPNVIYEIYGAGPFESSLKKYALELGVQNSVKFNGVIPYESFNDVLKDSSIFIGSGTAIIEAAALGIPAIVGIESIKTPETYGFFGDIEGISYNELVEGRQLFGIKEKIFDLLTNFEIWELQSKRSKLKAGDFSVKSTVSGFTRIFKKNGIVLENSNLIYSNKLSFLSFITCSILHMLKINKKFSNRRNQGSI